MCGITGWIDWNRTLTQYSSIVENMTETMAPRGPDAKGTWLSEHCALGHRRLSVMDPENGAQPMYRRDQDNQYVIVYNGELYNAPELKKELEARGYGFRTTCDTEVLLCAYIEWGRGCVDRLNGIFAFGVWNDNEQTLFLCRDRVGVKPLFYRLDETAGTLLFGSEPKAILAHPDVKAVVGAEGLAEVFAVGPARTPGVGVFDSLSELKPGHFALFDRNGLRVSCYWKLEAAEHGDDVDSTAERVRELLQDTVERQLASDVPIGTLLSGGLDSSALTAIAARYYRDQGLGAIPTFSVDYVDNDRHFQSNAFTPNADGPWIQRMTEFLGTVHHSYQFDTPELFATLQEVVAARDMPGMADIDASLLLFCREIKKKATVAISGEAADEIFGGYPWFHREDSLNARTFPWSLKSAERIGFLSEEAVRALRPQEYLDDRYAQAVAEVPKLQGEDEGTAKMRLMSYLNITRFMPTLLDRKDRMSMAVGLEVRVPFCDHRLIEYVWNIPWEIKTSGDREKGILRKALRGILPEDVITRKKSPYPKTHNPNYLSAVRSWMLDILDDPSSPILPFIDANRIRQLAASQDDTFNIPWFGQLMNLPQLFAYLGQVNHWLKEYRISVKL